MNNVLLNVIKDELYFIETSNEEITKAIDFVTRKKGSLKKPIILNINESDQNDLINSIKN